MSRRPELTEPFEIGGVRIANRVLLAGEAQRRGLQPSSGA